jgi:hypothetical protein
MQYIFAGENISAFPFRSLPAIIKEAPEKPLSSIVDPVVLSWNQIMAELKEWRELGLDLQC